jgi:hypothetical protein
MPKITNLQNNRQQNQNLKTKINPSNINDQINKITNQ